MYYKKIHKLRKEMDLSQEDLAKKIGVTKQVISKWESGIVMPDINSFLKLSELFKVSIDYLLKDDKSDSDFNYYPINIEKKNSIEKYQIVALVIMVLSVMTLITFILISIAEPMSYYDVELGLEYQGLKAYWHTYPEVKYGVIISLIGFFIAGLLLFLPKKIIKKFLKI